MVGYLRDLVVVAALAVACGAVWAARDERIRIDRLQARVDCMEHPHGESSIAGELRGGRFVVTRPVVRTGCTP